MTASTDLALAGESKDLAPTTLVRGMQTEFAMALGGTQLAERFVRVALTALGRNPDLANCTRETLLGGLMTCAQLRLEPNDPRGLAYLIPFKNTKQQTTEAQLVIGYKGLIDLAYRSGQIKTIAAEPVHEKDDFTEQRWPRLLTHRAAHGERGDVVTYYAAVEYKDGGQDFAVMSVDEIERHRDRYSRGHKRDDSPWKTAFDAMARKTVLRRLAKMMPLAVEDLRHFAAAVHVDGTTGTVDSSRSLEDLFARERGMSEPLDPQLPGRVTRAEILGAVPPDAASTGPVAPAPVEADTSGRECPGCGGPYHEANECPNKALFDPEAS